MKPIDKPTLTKAAEQTLGLITVEDHHPDGGVGEAVKSCLGSTCVPIISLAVRKQEMSGTPEELLDYEDISSHDIIQAVKQLVSQIN